MKKQNENDDLFDTFKGTLAQTTELTKSNNELLFAQGETLDQVDSKNQKLM